MEITFDISEDELAIFLAEVDEHLHVLDDILIRLEKGEPDPELVQTVFRSAHTIKGMCGMIGHRRMTDLTHTLETALDGVRKNTIQISTDLINLCLEAVDQLRILRDEVVTSQVSDINIDDIVLALKNLVDGKSKVTSKANAKVLNAEPLFPITPAIVEIQKLDPNARTVLICAKIDPDSIAPAARAFQLMMALQDMGDIQTMLPTQEQIESSAAISEFSAVIVTSQPLEKICKELGKISDVDEVSVDGKIMLINGDAVSDQVQRPEIVKSKPEKLDTTLYEIDQSEIERSIADFFETEKPEIERPDPLKFEPVEKIEHAPAIPAKAVTPPANTPSVNERRSASPFGRRTSDMTVRTNVERLNSLMNLVGELITDRNHLHQIRGRLRLDSRRDDSFEQLSETVTHLGRITDQLQEEVMRIRMLPIGSVLTKFPRTVRDLSQKVGKLIDVVIHGEETEMDRSMIEEINDPLIHLIRNSVDHGVETPEERLAAGKPERGTITLTARHEQGRIIITVEDDGGGIDGEKLRKSAVQKGLMSADEAAALTKEQCIDLMFMAGLSTSKNITDISGRGVGLDIVNTNIQRINGTIQVETTLGQGTCFQIVLPLTLAIVPSLLVKVNQATFAIPLVMITETLRLEQRDVKYVYRNPVTLLRGNVLSLIQLSDIFNHTQNQEQQKYLFAVVVQSGKQRIGLVVDSLIGEEEVVVKPLGAFIGDIPGVSSAAILGEGQVALIVDVFSLFKLAGI